MKNHFENNNFDIPESIHSVSYVHHLNLLETHKTFMNEIEEKRIFVCCCLETSKNTI